MVEFGFGSDEGDMQCVDIPILDDLILEDRESFAVTITGSDAAVSVNRSFSAAVQILDDDGKYEILLLCYKLWLLLVILFGFV